MSRHNRYNNYNNYSKPDTANEVPEAPINTPVVDPSLSEDENNYPAPAPVIGVVTGCKRLNVRSKPSKESAIITTIVAGDKVTIGVTENGFYEVHSIDRVPGFHGFCMEDFITIE